MQTTTQDAFALAMADQMIADRFARDYHTTTFAAYLDHLDQRTTAHLPDHMAERVIRTAGQQRRNARLSIEDGVVIIAIPLHDAHTGETVWVELYFSTWLNVIECGADQAWFYAHKGADRAKGQVRTHIPLSHGERVSLTRFPDTVARLCRLIRDGTTLDPMTVWWSGARWIVLESHNRSEAYRQDAERQGIAKTPTRAHARDKLALRASLARKGGDE